MESDTLIISPIYSYYYDYDSTCEIPSNINDLVNDLKTANLESVTIPQVNLDKLQNHLHSSPKLPNAIPYVTSYYKKNWGFCLQHNQRKKLKKGKYQILIDTDLKMFGDIMGYGWTPYGHGYGMQQKKPGIGDMKYNEDWRGKEKIIDEELIKKDHSAKIVLAKSLTGTTIRDIFFGSG